MCGEVLDVCGNNLLVAITGGSVRLLTYFAITRTRLAAQAGQGCTEALYELRVRWREVYALIDHVLCMPSTAA